MENIGLTAYGRMLCIMHISGRQWDFNVFQRLVIKYSIYNNRQDSIQFISLRYID